ncbi:MAK10-like protein [Tanacetum coccineum]|uniref:MAK10-like protein n=1 Tax=Tanacetum coccineum TaxID=301880 RepID=A0ABQ5EP59_9ASTR
MNTIELPIGNNVVPLRSDTIRLVQNGCSFHRLRSEDPNQHLKDFLKLVDSLDLDGENRERTRMRLFQFSFCNQASNWLERLPAGSITTWEDLTTRFLAQFIPPGRTAKLRNDILMFQQHQGESISEAWTCFKDLLQKVPHHGIDLWLQVKFFYDHVNPVTRRTIDQLAGDKLRDQNVEGSWALLEDLTLYDNESWNDPRDLTKPVKAIYLPQDVPSTSNRLLIELENQVQCLMEAHIAPMQPTQVNKITSSCEIYSGPHDTQYCMENPEQAFVEYSSSHNNKVRGRQFTTNPGPRNFKDATKTWKDKPNFSWERTQSFTSPQKDRSLPIPLENEAKEEGSAEPSATKYKNHEMTVEDEEEVESEKEFEEGTEEEKKDNPKHFDTFSTIKALRYHEWLLKNPRPHEIYYKWIISNRLEQRRKPSNPKKICNFVGRVKGLRVFIGNFTYKCNFMVLEDTTRSFSKKMKRKFCSEAGDGIRIYPDDVVIFDEKMLGSS